MDEESPLVLLALPVSAETLEGPVPECLSLGLEETGCVFTPVAVVGDALGAVSMPGASWVTAGAVI